MNPTATTTARRHAPSPVDTLLRAARAALLGILALATIPSWAGPYTAVYFFGDSLTDTGNAFAASGLPQPPYLDGRITNGNNYADRLAQRLGLSATAAAAPGGTNFAVATATAAAGPVPINLPEQVLAYGLSVGAVDPQALYVFWFGSNDVRNAPAPPGDAGAAISAAIAELQQAIGTFAALGARNFLIADVPSLGFIPAVTALNEPLATFIANTYSAAFNSSLASMVQLLEAQHGAARFNRLHANALFGQALLDPAAFGFSNVTDACFTGSPLVPGSGSVCADPDAHLFWDDLHPSAATHRLLGDLAFAAVVPLPAPALLLAGGLALLGFAGRRRSGARRGAH